MSAETCGCDKDLEFPWICERHRHRQEQEKEFYANQQWTAAAEAEQARKAAEWKEVLDRGTTPTEFYTQDVHTGEKHGPFQVKDSGQRQQFSSGMQRDVQTDKTDYSLVFDGPMLERWATHLTKGAVKYSSRNWMKANGQEELDRFKQSAVRHFVQWLRGDQDEDHAAATYFNICGVEFVKEKLQNAKV